MATRIQRLCIDAADPAAEVARLEALGATRIDVGQRDVSWVVREAAGRAVVRWPTPTAGR